MGPFRMVLLFVLILLGVRLVKASAGRSPGHLLDARGAHPGPRRPRGRQGLPSDDGKDPLQVEFEPEEQVAREPFERRYAPHPQCFCAAGQIQSK